MLTNAIETNPDVVAKHKSRHRKGTAPPGGVNPVMMRQYEAIKLMMVADEKSITPIVFSQHITKFLLGVPFCVVLGRPFDGGAVRLKTRVSDITFCG